MPFPRPVDATLHGVTDYSAGTLLVTAFPRLVGLQATPAGRQIRTAGAIHAGYSTLTDYPLGIVKLIPFQRHWLPHVGLCLFELASLAMTDPTGEGDFHGDIEAVRRGNMEQPHRKIYNGGPAVRPAAARAA